jgi:8-oxo-dGTP pyrophosphatase MutT (NUDIX family)
MLRSLAHRFLCSSSVVQSKHLLRHLHQRRSSRRRSSLKCIEYAQRMMQSNAKAGQAKGEKRASKDLFRFDYEHRIEWTKTMLPFNVDKYGGVVVDLMNALNDEVVNADDDDSEDVNNAFERSLDESLESWKRQQCRGCWVRVPIHVAKYVPILVERGFVFHHCESEYVMMTKWLKEDEENKLPAAATHHVGIGAFVTRVNPFDDKKIDVLMVQELRGPAAGRDLWKLPTGLLDVGEDVPEAACREVFEETGVKSEFQSILSARHSHGTHFGRSDMFFVVALKALTDDLVKCPKEIAKVEWKDLEFFANNPKIVEGTAMWKLNRQCFDFANGNVSGLQSDFFPAGMNRPNDVRIYFGESRL